MSAILLSILSLFSSLILPWLQEKLGLAVSKAGTLTALDLIKSLRVALCAAAGAAVVGFLNRLIPDGLVTFAVAGCVAGFFDLGYRLVKGE